MPFVADNSIVVGWFIASQADTNSNALLERAITEDVHVPVIWRAEFASILLVFMHKRRLNQRQTNSIIEQIEKLEMIVDSNPPLVAALVDLGRRHSLGAYDAAYLELALRMRLPLATRDKALRNAAIRAGVAIA